MIRRVVALSLVLGLASVAQGAVNVELQQSGSTVEVYLSQDEATPHLLRLVEFRFGATDPALTVSNFQWDIGAVGHYKDEDLAGGPDGVAVAFAQMAEDAGIQATLPATGSSVRVATFQVTCPDPGDPEYVLDVLNPALPSSDLNGTVSYGFGLGGPADDIVYLNPPADLTGGNMMFQCVVDVATLVSASPGNEVTLPRIQGNVVKLTFSRALVAAPAAGELLVQEMQAGPAYGADQSANFTFTIDAGDASILWIQDDGANLPNETWYAFRNTGGWAGVGNFEVQHPIVFGNVNDSAETDVTDVTQVLGNRVDPAPFDALEDVNASGAVDVTDVTITLGNRGSMKPAKPF